MNSRLLHLFSILETDRLRIRGEILPLTQQLFNYSPPGKWSVNQILSHVIAGERMTLHYLRKKSLGIAVIGDSGVKEELKMIALTISQRLPFRFKAPAPVVQQTVLYTSPALLMDEWAREREELKIFLESVGADQLKKMIYRHVRAGYMNIQHALLFYHEHFRHHLPQLKRLMKPRAVA